MAFSSVPEVFELMPEVFNPAAASGLDAVFQYDISGPSGGQWNCIIKDGSCEVQTGMHSTPSVTLSLSDTDYLALVNGQLNAIQAYMSGRLKVSGNLMLAQKLPQLFKKP